MHHIAQMSFCYKSNIKSNLHNMLEMSASSVTSPTALSMNSVIQICLLVLDVSFQFVGIRDLDTGMR